MTKMRVVYDSQIFCAQRFGGISRYFASLTRELAALPDVSPRIVAPLHINDYVGRLPRGLVCGRQVAGPRRGKALLFGVSSLAAECVQLGLKPDLVHQT